MVALLIFTFLTIASPKVDLEMSLVTYWHASLTCVTNFTKNKSIAFRLELFAKFFLICYVWYISHHEHRISYSLIARIYIVQS